MFKKNKKFSLWCDFIERDFLYKGFKGLIDTGKINGATSNPTIFQKAFSNSLAYKEDIKELKGQNPKYIYEFLAKKDIALAADILHPLYKNGNDGFISMEIDPMLCDNIDSSIQEGKRLFNDINKDNLMIKVPATNAGYKIITALVQEGINVNATLVFSPKQTICCLDAIEEGLKDGQKNPSCVISIFVSRLDKKCDKVLQASNIEQGKLGIINAQKSYNIIEQRGLNNVRALFASTGVKDNKYSKDHYITYLLHHNCVNTAPIDAIESFDGDTLDFIDIDKEYIDLFFSSIKGAGVDIEIVYQELLNEGLSMFKNSFEDMLKSISD